MVCTSHHFDFIFPVFLYFSLSIQEEVDFLKQMLQPTSYKMHQKLLLAGGGGSGSTSAGSGTGTSNKSSNNNTSNTSSPGGNNSDNHSPAGAGAEEGVKAEDGLPSECIVLMKLLCTIRRMSVGNNTALFDCFRELLYSANCHIIYFFIIYSQECGSTEMCV